MAAEMRVMERAGPAETLAAARPLDIGGVARTNGHLPKPGWFPAQCIRCRGWTMWRHYGIGKSLVAELSCGSCGRLLAIYTQRGNKRAARTAAANPVLSDAQQAAAMGWLAGERVAGESGDGQRAASRKARSDSYGRAKDEAPDTPRPRQLALII